MVHVHSNFTLFFDFISAPKVNVKINVINKHSKCKDQNKTSTFYLKQIIQRRPLFKYNFKCPYSHCMLILFCPKKSKKHVSAYKP